MVGVSRQGQAGARAPARAHVQPDTRAQAEAAVQARTQAAVEVRKPAPLLVVKDLVKHYPVTQGILRRRQVASVRAVDGISFEVYQGETLGLVGESGCGKSTTGRVLMRLEEPTSGKVWFDGTDWFSLSQRELRARRREMQIVFQDPFSSLNPRMTVGQILGEPMYMHGIARGAELQRRIEHLLEVVGLDRSHGRRYPTSFQADSASG